MDGLSLVYTRNPYHLAIVYVWKGEEEDPVLGYQLSGVSLVLIIRSSTTLNLRRGLWL